MITLRIIIIIIIYRSFNRLKVSERVADSLRTGQNTKSRLRQPTLSNRCSTNRNFTLAGVKIFGQSTAGYPFNREDN